MKRLLPVLFVFFTFFSINLQGETVQDAVKEQDETTQVFVYFSGWKKIAKDFKKSHLGKVCTDEDAEKFLKTLIERAAKISEALTQKNKVSEVMKKEYGAGLLDKLKLVEAPFYLSYNGIDTTGETPMPRVALSFKGKGVSGISDIWSKQLDKLKEMGLGIDETNMPVGKDVAFTTLTFPEMAPINGFSIAKLKERVVFATNADMMRELLKKSVGDGKKTTLANNEFLKKFIKKTGDPDVLLYLKPKAIFKSFTEGNNPDLMMDEDDANGFKQSGLQEVEDLVLAFSFKDGRICLNIALNIKEEKRTGFLKFFNRPMVSEKLLNALPGEGIIYAAMPTDISSFMKQILEFQKKSRAS